MDPGLEEVKVGNIVLSEGRCDFREMFFNQLVKDLSVESYSWKTALEELSHVVIFDKRDQDPER